MFDESNVPINCDEIMKAIDGLHHSKSSGPDRVLNEFIISGKNVLCQYLCTLFNGSIGVLYHYTKRGALIMFIIIEVSPY